MAMTTVHLTYPDRCNPMKTRIPALVHGLGLTLAVSLLPNQALADWGEEAWGTMIWGVSVRVRYFTKMPDRA